MSRDVIQKKLDGALCWIGNGKLRVLTAGFIGCILFVKVNRMIWRNFLDDIIFKKICAVFSFIFYAFVFLAYMTVLKNLWKRHGK